MKDEIDKHKITKKKLMASALDLTATMVSA